ncbi:isocitrate lyase [Rhizobium wenxiniae]|uniref:isocitrate lyase n=1 Tax=Rhizobium wenxiniae TaxID=1737357 RepID=UPI001C6E8152|nr:isocitrate lyase [Rhizobium wenxiniae]MBW9091571.1 isocitrate lyase [Rhizobium wenxiniae]
MTDFYKLVANAPEGRFDGITRPYSAEDVQRLRGSIEIRYSLAEKGANRLWELLRSEDFVNALGAMTGNQAMQQVRAGLKAIYLSGWQVAADSNTASSMYPDQSLYPANAAPELARRINRTLQRADQIETSEGKGLSVETWFAPIVADAEAGFGGPLNAFEIMKAFIEAGAAGVHFEDQLASEKKCGHLGGKVLIPTAAHIRNLTAARLAADVMGVPTLVIARTDAEAAKLLTSDIDERDRPFVDYDAGRTAEGFYRVKNGLEPCIARAVAYAPHCDLIWCETSKPDLEQARKFAEGVHRDHPGKMLAYNCSPSFNWKKNLDDATIAKFQRELGAMGYKFQFITLAGFHQLNFGMFELARGYRDRQMAAYSELQEAEFASEINGYTATKHQREVGTGYFDAVSMAITGGLSSTTAMGESTEHAQFRPAAE